MKRLEKLVKRLEPYATLAAVILAAWSFRSAYKSGTEMEGLLSGLNSSFETTRAELATLPVSVARFDSTVNSMSDVISEQQAVLSGVADTLSTQVSALGLSLSNYKDQLDKIVEASDQQLSLLEKRQALLEKELGRKSHLRVRFDAEPSDSGTWRVYPVVINSGNAMTGFYTFFFDLPDSFRVTPGPHVQTLENDDQTTHFSFSANDPVGFSGDTGLFISSIPAGARFEILRPPAGGVLPIHYTVVFEHGSITELTLVVAQGVHYRKSLRKIRD